MLEAAFEALPSEVKPVVYALLFLGAFFLGGIPWAYIVAKKVAGLDIRTVGSGNVGATNVARAVGYKWGLLVLFLDALKGFLPVLLIRLMVPYNVDLAVAMAFAPVLGHMFSPFMGFKGGKGVATSLGAFVALVPMGILLGFVVWLVVVLTTRFVSLGSLLGSLTVLVWVLFFDPNRSSLLLKVVAVLAVLLIWIRHRSNIRRLLRGEERKFF